MAKRKPPARKPAKRAPRRVAASRDPVTWYAQRVLSGAEPAGELVRLACARHLRWLNGDAPKKVVREDVAYAATWCPDAGVMVIDWIETFCPTESGEPMLLSPSQKFIVGFTFGWRLADRATPPEEWRRVVERVLMETPKGFGKSPLAAAMILAIVFVFQEPSPLILCAANTEDQANETFDHVKRMIESSPALLRRCEPGKKSIFIPSCRGVIRTVSSERRGLDGKKPSAATLDEIQEYPSDVPLVKIRKGFKGRRNPLLILTCNAGYSKESVSWHEREYAEKVLRGILDDETLLAFIPTLDPCEEHRLAGKLFPEEGCPKCDDWRDSKVWPKVNPNIGITIQADYLAKEVRESIGKPSQQNQTKRLNFNIWTEAAERWLPMDLWDECGGPHDWRALRERARGRRCMLGMDLAQVHDMSALSLWFLPEGDDPPIVVPFYWIPDVDILERSRRDRVPYDQWRDHGLLCTTPGRTTDYDFLERDFLGLASEYQYGPCAYDRRFSQQIINNLTGHGFTMVAFGQGKVSMSSPSKELERLVRSRGFWHGGHPILRWNASNVTVETDAGGQISPVKSSATQRIDGIAASIMALALAQLGVDALPSVYEQFSAEQWLGGGDTAQPTPEPSPPADLSRVRRRSLYESDDWKAYAKEHGYL